MLCFDEVCPGWRDAVSSTLDPCTNAKTCNKKSKTPGSPKQSAENIKKKKRKKKPVQSQVHTGFTAATPNLCVIRGR